MEAGRTTLLANSSVDSMLRLPSTDRTPRVAEIRRLSLDCPADSVWFAGDTAVFVGTHGSILLVPIGGKEHLVAAHGDALLVAAGDGNRVVTAGADGRVLSIEPDGSISEIENVGRQRWVSTIAISKRGIAYGIGRDQFLLREDGTKIQRRGTASLTAIEFSPDGEILAMASREGVSLWEHGSDEVRALRAGAGTATSLRFSRDGLFLTETYYEPLLAVRQMDNDSILIMKGPTERVRSVDWAPSGPTLLASGARHLIVCPILSASGQLSTLPRLFAPYREQAVFIAHHPHEPVAAVSYADGLVLLVRLIDGAEIAIKSPDGETAGLAWSPSGRGLAIARTDGQAILFVIDFD